MSLGSELLGMVEALVGAYLVGSIDSREFSEGVDELLSAIPLRVLEVPLASRYASAFGLKCYGGASEYDLGEPEKDFVRLFAREYRVADNSEEHEKLRVVFTMRLWGEDEKAKLRCVLTGCDGIVKLASRADSRIFDRECYVFLGGEIGHTESYVERALERMMRYIEHVVLAGDDYCYYRPTEECIREALGR